MSLMGACLRSVSPAGAHGRLSTLIFHRVHAKADALVPLELDSVRFDRMCAWLARWFNVIALDDAVDRLAQGRLPERALAITFDDGYADNHDVALPILRRHKLTATFFVATGYLDGGRMWNDTIIESIRATRLDAVALEPLLEAEAPVVPLATLAERRTAIHTVIGRAKYLAPAQRQAFVDDFACALQVAPPVDLMLSGREVGALHRAGMQIGAHTVTHPILKGLDTDAARREIDTSRQTLQGLIDAPVSLFAYPNGKHGVDFEDATAALVRELGFAAAVTTEPGAGSRASDPFQLPRYTPWEPDRWRFGLRLWSNLRRTSALET